MSPSAKPALDDLAVGLAVLAFAGLLAWQTAVIPSPSVYAKVGPKAIPWVVTAMIGLLGVALTAEAWFGGWTHEHEHGDFDLRSMLWLCLGLGGNLALIETAGFVLASTLLFAATARAFESRRFVRDAAIGFALALVAYLGFDRVLGYEIGSGLIEDAVRHGFDRLAGRAA